MNEVPVDGAWSSWTEWSSCSVSCDGGTRTRTRTCTEPAPSSTGQDCSGLSKDFSDCMLEMCTQGQFRFYTIYIPDLNKTTIWF